MDFDPYTLRIASTGIILAISSVHIAILTFVSGLLVGYAIGRGIRYNRVIKTKIKKVRNGKEN